MQFLAPLFLLAMAGLAIPVVLHLTQREKKQVQRFPSLMFVRRIPYQSVRRRRVHNWLLLLVRMAALALLVAAFARPLIRSADAIVPSGDGAREVVVLLDSSYSMTYGDRWQQAIASANEALDDLSTSDRASLVLFSSGAEILVRSSGERDKLKAALATAKPGAGSTRYGPALKVAGSILADSRLPRREALLVSDFQRSGWRGEEGARLPQGARLTPVPITSGADQPNAGITGVTFARSTFSNQERVAVTVVATNRTDRAAPGTTVKLEFANIPVGSKPLPLAELGSNAVTFDPVTVSGPNLRGTVRISDDALAADNAYHFVLSPARPLRLLLVDRGSAEARRYLIDALSVGEAPKFDTVVKLPEAITDQDLRDTTVVLVNDTAVTGGVARRLATFVEQGGGLFIAAGGAASWPQDVDVLPGLIGSAVDRTRGEPARIGGLEYGHAVFEPFRGPRGGNFAAALVYEYRNVTSGKESQVLARFDSGAPALVERRVGRGRVLLWGAGLDRASSDLPLKPVFPVFIQQSARYLSAYREPEPWVTVGQVLDPTAEAAQKSGGTARVVLTPSGQRLPLQDEGADVLELTEPGFYELRSAGGGQTDVRIIASNVDPNEGDLTPMDPKDVALAANGTPGSSGEDKGTPLTAEAQENNQRLWWYLLCVGILFLGLDTVMSNRLAKT